MGEDSAHWRQASEYAMIRGEDERREQAPDIPSRHRRLHRGGKCDFRPEEVALYREEEAETRPEGERKHGFHPPLAGRVSRLIPSCEKVLLLTYFHHGSCLSSPLLKNRSTGTPDQPLHPKRKRRRTALAAMVVCVLQLIDNRPL